MASPAMRLRVLPRFPTRVEAVEPVFLAKTAGTYTFSWDYRGIAAEAAPDMALYVLLQDGVTGTFYRTELADLPTGATDWSTIQNRPAQIDGLASLATTAGALEQTGANTFAIRAIGGGGTALMTFADATAAYQPLNSALTTISTNGNVATASIANDAVTFAKMQNIATGSIIGRSTASTGDPEQITVSTGLLLSGGVLTATGVAASGSTINSAISVFTTGAVSYTAAIPLDNTIPQISEGTEIQTASLTASNASNKVRFLWLGQVSQNTGGSSVIAAVFRDATANALASNFETVTTANYGSTLFVMGEITAGDTSSHTYRVRIGPSANTAYVNGNSAALLGGSAASVLLVWEVKA